MNEAVKGERELSNSGRELPPDQLGAAVQLANEVVKRKMSVPAVFFLELHKPLTGLFHAGALMTVPFLTPFFGARNVNRFINLFGSRDFLEILILQIEEQEQRRRGGIGRPKERISDVGHENFVGQRPHTQLLARAGHSPDSQIRKQHCYRHCYWLGLRDTFVVAVNRDD